MEDNKKKTKEKKLDRFNLSQKGCRERLEEMGKNVCPEAKTTASSTRKFEKRFKISGPYERVYCNGVALFGERDAIEKFLRLQALNGEVKTKKEEISEIPEM